MPFRYGPAHNEKAVKAPFRAGPERRGAGRVSGSERTAAAPARPRVHAGTIHKRIAYCCRCVHLLILKGHQFFGVRADAIHVQFQ